MANQPVTASTASFSSADIGTYVQTLGRKARSAAATIAIASSGQKNQALLAMANAIESQAQNILKENARDVAEATTAGLDMAMLDRLELTSGRIQSMADGLRKVAAQSDPVGTLSESTLQPSGLEIARMRVPLGVIGVIYESRPNVTADAAAICLKSGNTVILRGGSEAMRSNKAISRCIQAGLLEAELPLEAVQLIETTDRAAVGALLAMDQFIDVIIPRGGKGLVSRISEEARVPVIKHLDGICHVFIDAGADLQRAVDVAVNAKTYRYGICGAMETLLIHDSEASRVLPMLSEAFARKQVELRGCEVARLIVPAIKSATDADWHTEYLAPILSIKVVADVDEAMAHIAEYGSGHTDAIVTESRDRARKFVRQVDSSSVLVNAATCFADGAEYGLGAEIGISTNRMHVRGPVGAQGLTVEKYVVNGDYTTRA